MAKVGQNHRAHHFLGKLPAKRYNKPAELGAYRSVKQLRLDFVVLLAEFSRWEMVMPGPAEQRPNDSFIYMSKPCDAKNLIPQL